MTRTMRNTALRFAMIKHHGQKRDGGEQYVMHPMEVAKLLEITAPNDDNLIAAAYLHDTIEDTDVTYEDLTRKFNKDIADLVMEVTAEGSEGTKHFPRLETRRGIMLKFADRLSNISDMGTWDQKRQQQYLDKSKFWKDGR